jgi:hypothetical protein
MDRGPEKIGRFLGAIVVLALCLLLSSCSSYRLVTANDDMYPVDYVIPVNNETKIDTLSYSQLRWKLRTDFNFRWDYAQFAMNQPYNWYSSNFSYNIWRPINSFDVYFNRYDFWYDWAFNYPYNWGYSSWHNPWYNSWNNRWWRPYNWGYSWYQGPWYNSGYNIIWNSSRENNSIAYISGRRGSRNFDFGTNSNIQNNIVNRYNKPRVNVDNSNLNNIVDELRDNYGIKPRVYNNPNNVPNNNSRPVINNNNIKPSWNNSKPTYNNNNNNFNSNSSIRSNNSFSPPPTSSNISRGSSISSGGSSRGGNSRGNN